MRQYVRVIDRGSEGGIGATVVANDGELFMSPVSHERDAVPRVRALGLIEITCRASSRGVHTRITIRPCRYPTVMMRSSP
jgi:hypothetical protein